MAVKIMLALLLGVLAVSAVPTASEPSGSLGRQVPLVFGNPWMLQQNNPWIPPWAPQWVPCSTFGSTCSDCRTRLICKMMGAGFSRACNDSALPYCNLGACSATPTAECAPAAAPVPAAQSVPVAESAIAA